MSDTKGWKAGESKYSEEMLEITKKVCDCFDVTNSQLAQYLGVSESAIKAWCHKHPEFKEVLENSRYRRDGEVLASFFKKAKGYVANKVKVLSNGEIIHYQEEVPPDTIAGIFYLKNRLPEDWKDRQETFHSGNINVTPVISIGGINEQMEIIQEDTTKTKALPDIPTASSSKTTSSV